MCDPAVSSFLTQTLCAHGGRLSLQELQETIGLPAPQLHDTLRAAGPRRFLVLEGGSVVLAVTDARVCVLKECDGCERLHLCKLHLTGRCHLRASSCKYSHDIMSAENKKVLKKHDLSGLCEIELQVLLLQNDPFFLPDTCHLYNRKGRECMQQNNCTKLHVCRHFLLGRCKFPQCVMSHNLLDEHASRVLEAGGIDGKIASNFQAICDYMHIESNKPQKKGHVHNCRPRNDYWKKTAVTRIKELKTTSETEKSVPHVLPSEGSSSTTAAQSQDQLPTGAGDKEKDKGSSSTTAAQSQDQLPTGAGDKEKDKGSSSTTAAQSQDQLPKGARDKKKGNKYGFASRAVISIHLPSSTAPAQSQDQLPTGVGNKDEGKRDRSSDKDAKHNKKDNCDEICLFYVWRYCKNKEKCKSVHYRLPYKWEIHDGLKWQELPMMEEIEKAYCDPKNSSFPSRNIDFQTMTCSSSLVRRLSTPSSVTKPTFVLTTQWVWYWKNNQDKWVEYGEKEEGSSTTSPSSAFFENIYQADPCAVVRFHTDQHQYELNFKEMAQTNIAYKTRRQVCRRPKFVSSADVQKIKTSPKDSSTPDHTYPSHWDASALPDFGYKKGYSSSGRDHRNRDCAKLEGTHWDHQVQTRPCSGHLKNHTMCLKDAAEQKHLCSLNGNSSCINKFADGAKPNTADDTPEGQGHPKGCGQTREGVHEAVVVSSETSEYNGIKKLFHQTMKNYNILKIERIQNPSLWTVFQWQKEKMKRENGGKEVQEKQLFHGTDDSSMKTICTQNFDWRICGSNGTDYGKGSYFARDAQYAHAYCQATAQGHLMFAARVLVGDYVKGNAAYVRPPEKSAGKLWFYDSCVDDEFNPSVFVVFDKHQVYPEYIIEYEKERIREQKEAGIRAYGAEEIEERLVAGLSTYGLYGMGELGPEGLRTDGVYGMEESAAMIRAYRAEGIGQQKAAGIRAYGAEGIGQQKAAGIRAYGAEGIGQQKAAGISAYGVYGTGQQKDAGISAYGVYGTGQQKDAGISAYGVYGTGQQKDTGIRAYGVYGTGQQKDAGIRAYGVYGTGQQKAAGIRAYGVEGTGQQKAAGIRTYGVYGTGQQKDVGIRAYGVGGTGQQKAAGIRTSGVKEGRKVYKEDKIKCVIL